MHAMVAMSCAESKSMLVMKSVSTSLLKGRHFTCLEEGGANLDAPSSKAWSSLGLMAHE